MIPTYVIYQKNNGQGHDCFSTLFRPTNSKIFFRNLRMKIHKLARFHGKKFELRI